MRVGYICILITWHFFQPALKLNCVSLLLIPTCKFCTKYSQGFNAIQLIFEVLKHFQPIVFSKIKNWPHDKTSQICDRDIFSRHCRAKKGALSATFDFKATFQRGAKLCMRNPPESMSWG